jgi:hypothetical protein
MKNNKYFVISTILFLLVSCSPKPAPFMLGQLKGEWLNKVIVDSLIVTKSPRKSIYSCDISNITIGDDFITGEEVFHATLNGRLVKTLNATKTPFVFTVAGSINDTIAILDKDTMNTVYLSKGKITIVRLKDSLNVFVNRIIIAGKYRDIHGKVYIFTEDGITNWPRNETKYSICIDYNSIEKDCITFTDQGGKSISYGFSFKGKHLRFHKEKKYSEPVPDDYMDFEDKPFIELIRM